MRIDTRTRKRILTSKLYISPEKQKIRDILLHSHRDPQWVFTFAGVMGKEAKMFASSKGCHVTSIERDPIIFKEQVREFKPYPNISLRNVSFSQFVKGVSKEAPFDVSYLDFQGIISTTIEKDFSKFLDNRQKSGSVIGITFCRSRDGFNRIKNTYCLQCVCQGLYSYYIADRDRAISTTLISLAEKRGVRLKRLPVNKNISIYRNNFGKAIGSPMMFLMFKVC